MRAGLHIVCTLALAFLAIAPAAAQQETGRIEGRVVLGVEGVGLANAGPIVVYVQPERSPDGTPAPQRTPEIRQVNARFTPSFMAIAQGQTIQMPNEDDIDHNVYSTSEGNEFDLGIYEAGQVRSVKLKKPGEVDIHCSIHESMNATVFVSPSPFFARAEADGRFTIPDLPPGRYRLRTWSQRLPRAEMYFRVRAGETLRPSVVIGAP